MAPFIQYCSTPTVGRLTAPWHACCEGWVGGQGPARRQGVAETPISQAALLFGFCVTSNPGGGSEYLRVFWGHG